MSKSCKKTIATAINYANEEIESLYISSKKPRQPPTETELFPLGDPSKWLVKNGEKGTYHLYCTRNGKTQLIYVGQGGLINRVRKNLLEHQEYYKKGLKKAKKRKSKERWSISPKLYNISKDIKKWKVQFVSFDTGNPLLDKFYAKKHEDVMIEVHEPPLNCKKGDNT
tara:strand:- start:42 stop:545 length:504 start_codon:yes stop_codon:yes gene_type:complete